MFQMYDTVTVKEGAYAGQIGLVTYVGICCCKVRIGKKLETFFRNRELTVKDWHGFGHESDSYYTSVSQ